MRTISSLSRGSDRRTKKSAMRWASIIFARSPIGRRRKRFGWAITWPFRAASSASTGYPRQNCWHPVATPIIRPESNPAPSLSMIQPTRRSMRPRPMRSPKACPNRPTRSKTRPDMQAAGPTARRPPVGPQPDDLKRIRGIGPKNEGRLHGLGIWHFTQIRAWSEENVKWVGSYLAFAGRIDREKWVDQARELAAGHETEFSRRVAAGKVATSKDDGSLGQGNVRIVK